MKLATYQTANGNWRVLVDGNVHPLLCGFATESDATFSARDLYGLHVDIETSSSRVRSYRRTCDQIVDACNNLAHRFYHMHGNSRPSSFKFYEATHPIEAGMWNLAVAAYDYIEGTDVEQALSELQE